MKLSLQYAVMCCKSKPLFISSFHKDVIDFMEDHIRHKHPKFYDQIEDKSADPEYWNEPYPFRKALIDWLSENS
jgi:hypothetical protein